MQQRIHRKKRGSIRHTIETPSNTRSAEVFLSILNTMERAYAGALNRIIMYMYPSFSSDDNAPIEIHAYFNTPVDKENACYDEFGFVRSGDSLSPDLVRATRLIRKCCLVPHSPTGVTLNTHRGTILVKAVIIKRASFAFYLHNKSIREELDAMRYKTVTNKKVIYENPNNPGVQGITDKGVALCTLRYSGIEIDLYDNTRYLNKVSQLL